MDNIFNFLKFKFLRDSIKKGGKYMKNKIKGILIYTILISSILTLVVMGDESNIDNENYDNFNLNFTAISKDVNNSFQNGEKDTFEIYEGNYYELLVEASWNPPNEKNICLWIDASTLPEGASVSPNPSSGIDYTNLTVYWTPTYCQAGTYYLDFYGGETCYEPLGSLPVTIIVYNVNRPPSLYVNQPGPVLVEPGDTIHVDVFGNDLDVSECGDDVCILSSSDPDHFIDVGDCSGYFEWETEITDIGEHIVTFTVHDIFGSFDSVDVYINVLFQDVGVRKELTHNERIYNESIVYKRGSIARIEIYKPIGSTANAEARASDGKKIDTREIDLIKVFGEKYANLIKAYFKVAFGQEIEVIEIPIDANGPIGQYNITLNITLPNGTSIIQIHNFTVIFDFKKPTSWTEKEWKQWKHGKRERLYPEFGSRDVNLDFTNKLFIREINEIEKGIKDPTEAANKKRKWVSDHGTYGHNGNYGSDYCYPDIKEFFKRLWRHADGIGGFAQGECSDYGMIVVAKLRAENIPARVISGINVQDWNYHCWVEFWNGTHWKILDATPGYEEDAMDPKDYWNNHGMGNGDSTPGSAHTHNPNDGSRKNITSHYNPIPKKNIEYFSCPVDIILTTDEQEYMFGDIVNVNVEFKNTENIVQTIGTEIAIENKIPAGRIYRFSRINIFNQSYNLTLPPFSSENISIILDKMEYLNSGLFRIYANTNHSCSEYIDFSIESGLNVSILRPESIDINKNFNITLNITNLLDTSVINISGFLATPTYSSLQFTTFLVNNLSSKDMNQITYSTNISRAGTWDFIFYVYANETGGATTYNNLKVLAPPLIDVRNDYSPEFVNQIQTFIISGQLDNLGGYPLYDINVTLFLPPNMTTTDVEKIYIPELLAEETLNLTWNVTANESGEFLYAVFAMDVLDIYRDLDFKIITVGLFNSKPIVFAETPENGSVDVNRPPFELNISVEDPDSDIMNVYFKWKNHSGFWNELKHYSDVQNGSYNYTPLGNDWLWGNTTYTWSVNLTDGTYWTNKTFTFRTDGSRYDVSNNGVVNFQDAGLCWVNRDSVVAYDGLFDVNQDGTVNFQDAGLCWINRD